MNENNKKINFFDKLNQQNSYKRVISIVGDDDRKDIEKFMKNFLSDFDQNLSPIFERLENDAKLSEKVREELKKNQEYNVILN